MVAALHECRGLFRAAGDLADVDRDGLHEGVALVIDRRGVLATVARDASGRPEALIELRAARAWRGGEVELLGDLRAVEELHRRVSALEAAGTTRAGPVVPPPAERPAGPTDPKAPPITAPAPGAPGAPAAPPPGAPAPGSPAAPPPGGS